MSFGTLGPTLAAYATQLPLLLVWLVGVILAITNWQRYPKTALLTLIALGIFFLRTLIGTYLSMWLPLMLSRSGVLSSQIGLVITIQSIVLSLASALGWGLILAAIFGRREEAMELNEI